MLTQQYTVADSTASVTALAANDCWIAAAVTEFVSGPPLSWVVALIYTTEGSDGKQRAPVSILKSGASGLPEGARPTSLHISDDNVLVVGLGYEGMQLYQLRPPLPPALKEGAQLIQQCGSGFYMASVRWVASLACSDVALVAHAQQPTCDSLQVYGALLEKRVVPQELLSAGTEGILAMEATNSGFVAVVTKALVMHVLQLKPDTRFHVRTVSLAASLVTSEVRAHLLTFRSIAIGASLVAVGYDLPSGDGLVEVFEVDTGDLATCRSLPGRSPTALATVQRRVAVGASRRSAAESVVYGFVSTHNTCYAIAVGGKLQGEWHPGTLVIQEHGCVFAHCLDKGGLVVERWFPAAR